MDAKQEQIYAEAEQLTGYNALSLKAMALWAFEHRDDKPAMKIASFVWQRNARHLATAVDCFGEWFEQDRNVSVETLLSLFSIASVNKFDRWLLYDDWSSKSLALWQVKECVDELRQRKPREKRAQITAPEEQAKDLIKVQPLNELVEVWRMTGAQQQQGIYYACAEALEGVIAKHLNRTNGNHNSTYNQTQTIHTLKESENETERNVPKQIPQVI